MKTFYIFVVIYLLIEFILTIKLLIHFNFLVMSIGRCYRISDICKNKIEKEREKNENKNTEKKN